MNKLDICNLALMRCGAQAMKALKIVKVPVKAEFNLK